MNEQEIIKKLKDKTYVRAFGLMKPEEQEVYRKVGKRNCLYYTGDVWGMEYGFTNYRTYAIKPGYQPEPEYENLEIETGRQDGEYHPRLGAIVNGNFLLLHELIDLPNFDCFHEKDNLLRYTITEVSTKIDEGKKMYARFRAKGGDA